MRPRRRRDRQAVKITRLEQVARPGLESGGRGGMLAAGAGGGALARISLTCCWQHDSQRCAGACGAVRGGRLTQSVAGWLARSARRQPVRSSACLDAKLPGIRGDRRVAEAVVGVTVRAGGRACAAGPAGSAALLR